MAGEKNASSAKIHELVTAINPPTVPFQGCEPFKTVLSNKKLTRSLSNGSDSSGRWKHSCHKETSSTSLKPVKLAGKSSTAGSLYYVQGQQTPP